MTPATKRRLLEIAAKVGSCEHLPDRHVLLARIITATEMLRSLAAEGPPKCATCTHARRGASARLRCDRALPPGTVTVRDDFGCVLHSDYKE